VKAVVLVGGEGTRLRPLTETIPKPLLPLVDRPILDHVLDHLLAHGIREVIMSSPYLEATFHPFLEARGGEPSITWVTEAEPLGTGGAIVTVLDRLGDEPFLALNGDILTDLDLTAMVASHRERGAVATIALHHAEDARAFGLVATGSDGRISEFREKPADAVTGDVNAGTYVLDPEPLQAWPAGTYAWIEGEVFPKLIDEGWPLFGFSSGSYWLDLGTPEQYLQAHFDLLDGKVGGISYDAPWIGRGADVDLRAHLGRRVVIGEGAVVGAGARVDDSVLMPGATIDGDARVLRSIIGPHAIVREAATLVGCVLGEGATASQGATLDGARVAAGSDAPS
jgi:mannose-1-phosphate guanylyltransferase